MDLEGVSTNVSVSVSVIGWLRGQELEVGEREGGEFLLNTGRVADGAAA